MYLRLKTAVLSKNLHYYIIDLCNKYRNKVINLILRNILEIIGTLYVK